MCEAEWRRYNCSITVLQTKTTRAPFIKKNRRALLVWFVVRPLSTFILVSLSTLDHLYLGRIGTL